MYDRQRETRCDINPEYEAADTFGRPKTRDYVGGVNGVDAQSAALEPGGAVDKAKQPDAAKTAKPDSKGADAADQKTAATASVADLSPIRQALLKQYELLDGKGVGDAEFDRICPKATWDARQIEEKKSIDDRAAWDVKAAADPAWAKDNKKPAKVEHYTTCIDAQAAVLRGAFEAEKLTIKTTGKARYYFGPDAEQKGKKQDAWVPGSAGSGAHPKPGDILVLQMQGAKIDQSNAKMGADQKTFAKKEADLTKKIADLEAAGQVAEGAQAQAAKSNAPDLADQLAKLRAAHEAAKTKLQASLDKLHESFAKGGDTGDKHHQFSHVANFVGWKPEIVDGQPTGKEVWTTFDGGQMVWGKVGNQGSKKSERFYDTKTNEISGERTQGGDTRYLQGWIDVDKMVADGAEKKEGN